VMSTYFGMEWIISKMAGSIYTTITIGNVRYFKYYKFQRLNQQINLFTDIHNVICFWIKEKPVVKQSTFCIHENEICL
jgi:hypothetical protein